MNLLSRYTLWKEVCLHRGIFAPRERREELRARVESAAYMRRLMEYTADAARFYARGNGKN